MPTSPLIILAGMTQVNLPTWVQSLQSTFADDYRFAVYDKPARYISRLSDDYASLILVDGDADDWQFWTTTPKSSPATRRIEVIVVSDDEKRRAHALQSGANHTLTVDSLLQDAPKLFKDIARVVSAERAEQLACDCQAPLPELAQQGVEKFNAGEYYAQHDLFEELWMQTESPVRDLYRAILQVGIAYYQIQRGNHRGAKKMLLRSLQWLAILPNVCQGIDVNALKMDSARVRSELESMDESDITDFDLSLLQPVKFKTLTS